MDEKSLSHTSWNCKYHIVLVPKYRRKVIYGKLRKDIGKILRTLCDYKHRLPQKSSHVNVNLSGRGPSILLRKTVLSLKSPTGAFIASLRKRELLRTHHFRQLARNNEGNFGKKREPDGLGLLICFLPAVPDRVSAPHPPTRPACHRRSYTCRPVHPNLPLPGTR